MPVKQATSANISFKTKLFKIGSAVILRLPDEASKQLPSRGQVMVEGTFNGVDLKTPLEPTGDLGHYFRVSSDLQKAASVTAGDTVSVEVTPTKEWPEPEVPAIWKKALAGSTKASARWNDITPMARWEWIRWARATSNNETFERRIKVGISKMESTWRRPCCWNRNLCTEPDVSKNGVLLDPTREPGLAYGQRSKS
ncbi:MAG TPA: YdeI/OmpD-associated family protein [Candidatus Saccharimonadales bacterium]|nr:YdeI/OmpD-associated family protein [Candidatus Saccharimonadales bacterium]